MSNLAVKKILPTQKYLQECFDYCDATGNLYWKERPKCHFISTAQQVRFNKMFPGKIVGLSGNYASVQLNGERWLCHRIIYKMLKGEEPEYVDHIDGNPSNNRIENLRSVPFRENSLNQAKSKRNKTGVVGVTYEKERDAWRASISHNGKEIRKRFRTMEDAIAQRKEWLVEYGYHKNHGKRIVDN